MRYRRKARIQRSFLVPLFTLFDSFPFSLVSHHVSIQLRIARLEIDDEAAFDGIAFDLHRRKNHCILWRRTVHEQTEPRRR